MVWMPDHIWYAQQAAKGGGKGGKGKGNGKSKWGGSGGDLMAVLSSLGMGGSFGGKGWGKSKGDKLRAESKKTMNTLSKVENDRKVWIGGLPKGLTWKDLDKFCEEHATKPKLVNIMSYGKGVCAFKTAEEATAAIAALNGKELKGNNLEVDEWTKKEKKEKA